MNPQIIFLLNKSLEFLKNSNLESAELYLKQVLKLQINNPHALSLLGVISAQQEKYTEALNYLNDSLKVSPKNSSALNNLGNIYLELKEYDNALKAYDGSLKIDPRSEEAWSNMGNALQALKRYDEAIAHYDKALNLKPNYAEAWSNKGNVLEKLKLYDEAIAHYDNALNLKPNYAEAWSNKGWALHHLKRIDDAIAHYDRALSINHNYVIGWCNKGWALHELGLFDEAIAHYDKALNLKPNYAEAWSNKGNALHELKRYDEAITHYDKALSLKPDIDWIAGDLLHTKMKICDWSGLADSLKTVSKKVMEGKKFSTPFGMLYLSDDISLHKKSSEVYVKHRYPCNDALGPILKYANKEKIRVAYFSADFHNHATGYLIAELFELHDKNQFELIGFSFGPITNDDMRIRLEKSFNKFIEVGGLSDVEIAKLSRDLNIDIAIDLKGFTQHSRTGIFANRAAPIQVNYLGYPGTMGADYIDYIIADKILIPVYLQSFYKEKVVYLPHSYQVNDRKRVISNKQFTRSELGLPEKGFIFCCFNNNYKILPSTFAGWMRILKIVEDSFLWLLQDNAWVINNLKNEAQKQGVDPNRLLFADRMPPPEHLARHCQADLFLDTFPYNAHTTASDALWTGLPILTLMGQSFASRVTASLLTAISLQELITDTQEKYEALAIELAMNPQKLLDIKFKLANTRLSSPLFDTPLFTKHVESAYIQMYDVYKANLPSDNLFI